MACNSGPWGWHANAACPRFACSKDSGSEGGCTVPLSVTERRLRERRQPKRYTFPGARTGAGGTWAGAACLPACCGSPTWPAGMNAESKQESGELSGSSDRDSCSSSAPSWFAARQPLSRLRAGSVQAAAESRSKHSGVDPPMCCAGFTNGALQGGRTAGASSGVTLEIRWRLLSSLALRACPAEQQHRQMRRWLSACCCAKLSRC